MNKLPGAEAFKLAIDTAELGFSALNFFVVICLATAGWALTSNTVAKSKQFSAMRFFMAGAFLFAAGSIARGVYVLFEKTGTALTIATHQAGADTKIDADLKAKIKELYMQSDDSIALPNLGFTSIALGATLVFVVLLIFVNRQDTDASKKKD